MHDGTSSEALQKRRSCCSALENFSGVPFLTCFSQAEYQRYWFSVLNAKESPLAHPSPNDKDCRSSERFAPLFNTPVPEKLEGFELEDDDKMTMRELWPEGEDVALKVCFHKLH